MVQNFRDLLNSLATLCIHTWQTVDSKLPPFTRHAQSSDYQKRAFDILQLTTP